MEIKVIKCQGLPCPQPVLKVKEFLENFTGEEFIVVVDNEIAKENVSKFVSQKGYQVVESKGEKQDIYLKIKKSQPTEAKKENSNPKETKTLIFFTKNRLGEGSEELGKGLVKNFIATLKEMDNLWRIVLVNSGVKLSVKNSPVLEDLKDLEKKGVSILVCGTCLNHYNLLEEKEIGETTNMLDIVTSLELADKVITI